MGDRTTQTVANRAIAIEPLKSRNPR
jgi:hypothetical protein